MNKQLLSVIVLTLGPLAGRADVVLQDDFNYPDGRLVDVSGGVWTVHSSGANSLNIVGGGAVIFQPDASSGHEDVNRLFTQAFDPATDNSSQIYAGFTAKFLAVPYDGGTSTVGSYFAHFKSSAGSVFYSRIGAGTWGAEAGKFRLGISNSGWSPIASVAYPEDLELGVTYELIVRLDLATDQSTLWINPADASSPSVTATDTFSYSGTINAFALRQGTTGSSPSIGAPGTIAVDNLRVGTSFAEVRAVPEPTTWALLVLGGSALMLGRKRRG